MGVYAWSAFGNLLEDGVNETPPVMADSVEAVADRMKCDFCHTVTTDLFWSAIGLTPLGSAFNAQKQKKEKQFVIK